MKQDPARYRLLTVLDSHSCSRCPLRAWDLHHARKGTLDTPSKWLVLSQDTPISYTFFLFPHYGVPTTHVDVQASYDTFRFSCSPMYPTMEQRLL